MNRVILSGLIATDIDLKTNKVPMARFNLAVKGTKDTNFIPILAWNQTAEVIKQYCTKGSKLLVEGRIQTSEYEGKKYTEIVADRIEFLDTKKETPKEPKETLPKFEYGKQMEIKDDDLPWN